MATSWRRKAIAGFAAALLLTSCGAVSQILSGDEDPTRSPRSEPREIPTQLHPGLRDCAPQGSDSELHLPRTDLNSVTWKTPDGFVDVSGSYYEDNPVEDLQWVWVAASEKLPPNTLDVISVNYYNNVAWNAYVDECEAVPLTALEERLEKYRNHIGAKPLSEPEMTEINGYPVIKQDLRLDRYDYEGYWFFSVGELVHVYCQWENASAEKEIRRGCKELVSSVTVP